MWLYFVIMAVSVAVDFVTKRIVLATMEVGDSVALIPNVFHFTYVQNKGAAFGMLQDHRWVFLVLTTVVVAALIYYLVRYRPRDPWLYWPMSLIVGGGIGNMVDRLFYGEAFGDGFVVDFLDFCAFPSLWRWVFNVADACVVVGAFIMIGYLIVNEVKEMRWEKAQKDHGKD